MAPARKNWIRRNEEFYANDIACMRFMIPANQKILELGCGGGHLLSALSPAEGVGVDISGKMIESARQEFPDLAFHVGDIEDPGLLSSLEGPY